MHKEAVEREGRRSKLNEKYIVPYSRQPNESDSKNQKKKRDELADKAKERYISSLSQQRFAD